MAPSPAARRPLLWRLPLFGFLIVGLVCLQRLDALLVHEFESEAASQAVQMEALVRGSVDQRVTLIHNLQSLVSSGQSEVENRRRFDTFAPDVSGMSPDLRALYFLDSAGVVRGAFPITPEQPRLLGANVFATTDRGPALQRARATRRPAIAASVSLGRGGRGLVIYEPVLQGKKVVGYVGGAFAHRPLLASALSGRFREQFAYQLADPSGSLLGASAAYPARPAGLVNRQVSLPDDQRLQLALAVPEFEPFAERAITWLVGVLLLLLVVFLVLREERASERLASHSSNLEVLSKNLVDANVRLEERARQVAEANRAKSRFLANVSHELRTPLNAIVGYNALARDGIYGPLNPHLAEAHERIRLAASHLLAVVDNVLDLSKIEVGRMEVQREPVNLSEVIDEVVRVVEPIAAAKDVRLDVLLARDLPRLATDSRHVRQIILNLVTNAVKFTDEGWVSVSTRRDEQNASRVQVVVQDTGVGIAEVDLERIFDEFEQVRPSGRGDSQQRGTGLGLSISRKLARLLGGDVSVESEIGGGSRFTLTLPVDVLATGRARTSGVFPAYEPGARDREQPVPRYEEADERAPPHGRGPRPTVDDRVRLDADSGGG